jgi:hypothetical protein
MWKQFCVTGTQMEMSEKTLQDEQSCNEQIIEVNKT